MINTIKFTGSQVRYGDSFIGAEKSSEAVSSHTMYDYATDSYIGGDTVMKPACVADFPPSTELKLVDTKIPEADKEEAENPELTYEQKREIKKQTRAKQVRNQRIAAGAIAGTILAGGALGIGANPASQIKEPKTAYVYDIPASEMPDYSLDLEAIAAQAKARVAMEAKRAQEAKIQKAQNILSTCPEVKEAYDDLTDTLQRYTNHMGIDGLKLIVDKIDQFGNIVDPLFAVCVLNKESHGYVYRNGEYLKSDAEAYGPWQITDICELEMNTNSNPDGIIRDKMDPIQNAEIGISYLAKLTNLAGGNLKSVISYYNSGGKENFDYPEVADYIKVALNEHYDIIKKYPEVMDLLLEQTFEPDPDVVVEKPQNNN